MKHSVILAVAILAIGCMPPSWAGGDESEQASQDLALTGMVSAVAPVAIVAGVEASGCLATEATGKSIVKVVDKTGKVIGDLTEDAINEFTGTGCSGCADHNVPQVEACNKEIPLVVRKDYVEMNEQLWR